MVISIVPKVQNPTTHKDPRGGKRPGAGRPRTDTVPLQIQVSHHYATAWRAEAKRRGITLGELVAERLTAKQGV